MTKKEMFTEIRAIVADHADMVEFIDHEIELLSRKRTSTKPTKTQRENAVIKEQITAVLTDEPMTIGEINVAMGTEYSPQKLSALLRQLCLEGVAVKDTVGKVPYFALAE